MVSAESCTLGPSSLHSHARRSAGPARLLGSVDWGDCTVVNFF